jgi:hypothetical protein
MVKKTIGLCRVSFIGHSAKAEPKKSEKIEKKLNIFYLVEGPTNQSYGNCSQVTSQSNFLKLRAQQDRSCDLSHTRELLYHYTSLLFVSIFHFGPPNIIPNHV